jgi:hypothetical protein
MIFQNQQNNIEQASVGELKNCFQNIYCLVDYQELKSLILMIKHVQSQYINKISQTTHHFRRLDENVSAAIYEKCLLIKRKNEGLKANVLNLRATLSRLMNHNKQNSDK